MPRKDVKKLDPLSDVRIEDRGMVTVQKSVTKNMGDYNSARVEIGVTLPINYTPEDLKQAAKAIKAADKLVTEEVETQVADLLT